MFIYIYIYTFPYAYIYIYSHCMLGILKCSILNVFHVVFLLQPQLSFTKQLLPTSAFSRHRLVRFVSPDLRWPVDLLAASEDDFSWS